MIIIQYIFNGPKQAVECRRSFTGLSNGISRKATHLSKSGARPIEGTTNTLERQISWISSTKRWPSDTSIFSQAVCEISHLVQSDRKPSFVQQRQHARASLLFSKPGRRPTWTGSAPTLSFPAQWGPGPVVAPRTGLRPFLTRSPLVPVPVTIAKEDRDVGGVQLEAGVEVDLFF